MKVKIGDIELKNRIIVAPMAGITNFSFRAILKEMGASLIYTEMISDKALIYKNEKTNNMIVLNETERPVAIQLFGSEANSMGEATKIVVEKSRPDIIDINMGCPVNKVVKTGAGSKLMQDPKKAFKIAKSVVENSNVPVTVKIRAGWDKNSINAVEIAKILESAGVSAIAVHGRTRSQLYGGVADWDIIREVKESVKVPVFGNGDIFTAEDAKFKLDKYNVDGIMLARGVQGNPWLVRQAIDLIEHGKVTPYPNAIEKLECAIRHLESLIALKGEKIAVLEMRTHAPWYMKGLKNSNLYKKDLVKQNDVYGMKNYLNELIEIYSKMEVK